MIRAARTRAAHARAYRSGAPGALLDRGVSGAVARTIARALGATGPAALVAAVLSAGACAGRQGAGGDDAVERAVPLATIQVENRTGRSLDIWFRYLSPPGGDVELGSVSPSAMARLAPVPAEEPIVLTAKGDGFERRLPPRTFAAGERWTWVISEDGSNGG